MKIDKAIEILSEDLTYSYPAKFNELTDAIKLGIEALKSRQSDRENGVSDFCELLPGETE